ncbi:hypothetical protein O181_058768 [Austropuccinia psidii MF-1]|uniref:Zn(2)-C6 fungal-type domain-containing protein n=1 Tax=Austropuccinia psidii MF-1 TaxID=1389203 RepID=A0A9Q3HVW0_9BASI|nr:hypothetical protein [Austropuccinia psidii MF-1]
MSTYNNSNSNTTPDEELQSNSSPSNNSIVDKTKIHQTKQKSQIIKKLDESSIKKKKVLKRKPASCSACRRRRTRCDRVIPCSECCRRNTDCDYEGASTPSIIAHRNYQDQLEREEYINHLQDRIQSLEQIISTNQHYQYHHNPPSTSSSSPKTNHTPSISIPHQDFTTDDLARQLSNITIGSRSRASNRHQQIHPLHAQLESIISNQDSSSTSSIDLHLIDYLASNQQFNLNLVSNFQLPPLDQLCYELLPNKIQFDHLSNIYFNTLNIWSPSINQLDWKIQSDSFWNSSNRTQFRPSPSSSQPLHQSLHHLTHFLACLYAIAAHGLLRQANVHFLEPPQDHHHEQQQQQHHRHNSTPSNQSSFNSPDIFNLSQAQQISLANQWFHFSLTLLIGNLGQITIKPTVFGIRALSILSNVELAPENLDHGIFFWSLATNLAASAGLLNEPPISDDEDIDHIDEIEIESRRHLAWCMMGLDWAGHSIAGGLRQCRDPDQYFVKIPGTVISPNQLDPFDGWPLDPLLCVRKAAALSDILMEKTSNVLLCGQPATYPDILDVERQINELEDSLPERFQLTIHPNGKSFVPKVETDPYSFFLSVFLCARFVIARMRLHRLLIFPKPGTVSELERLRHLKIILKISRLHFLATGIFAHELNMHPLMLYSLVNTVVACALALLAVNSRDDVFEDHSFFIPEFHKVINLFNLGQKTISSSMARKAVALLRTLVEKIEHRDKLDGSMSWDRRKKGPQASTNCKSKLGTDSITVELKRKNKLDSSRHGKSKFASPLTQNNLNAVRNEDVESPPPPPQSLGQALDHLNHPMMTPLSSAAPLFSSQAIMSYFSAQSTPHSASIGNSNIRPVASLPFRSQQTQPTRFRSIGEKSDHLDFPFSPNLPQSPPLSISSNDALPTTTTCSTFPKIEFGKSNHSCILPSQTCPEFPNALLNKIGLSSEDDHGRRQSNQQARLFDDDFLRQLGIYRASEEMKESEPGKMTINPFNPNLNSEQRLADANNSATDVVGDGFQWEEFIWRHEIFGIDGPDRAGHGN